MPKKLDRCVKNVKKQVKDESIAYAICSKSTGIKRKKGGGWKHTKESFNSIYKKIINEEYIKEEMNKRDRELLAEQYENMNKPTMRSLLLPGFKEWLKKHPELLKDKKFVDNIDQINYDDYYDDVKRENQLVLGTTLAGGGDYLYDVIDEAGLLEDLTEFITDYAISKARPSKTRSPIKVIPYSEYQWNEDDWGEDL